MDEPEEVEAASRSLDQKALEQTALSNMSQVTSWHFCDNRHVESMNDQGACSTQF